MRKYGPESEEIRRLNALPDEVFAERRTAALAFAHAVVEEAVRQHTDVSHQQQEKVILKGQRNAAVAEAHEAISNQRSELEIAEAVQKILDRYTSHTEALDENFGRNVLMGRYLMALDERLPAAHQKANLISILKEVHVGHAEDPVSEALVKGLLGLINVKEPAPKRELTGAVR